MSAAPRPGPLASELILCLRRRSSAVGVELCSWPGSRQTASVFFCGTAGAQMGDGLPPRSKFITFELSEVPEIVKALQSCISGGGRE